MRHLTPADYRIMPWKNGGGTTTEIAISPQDSGISGRPFVWRVSIADVASDGPFSRFPGYDRHIMTIAGNGMTLDAGDKGTIDLTIPLVPRRFSGDWAVTGRLVAGPVRDFNLMTAWARAASSLQVVSLERTAKLSSEAETALIYMLEGEAMTGGHIAACGDTLIFKNSAAILSPLGGTATVAVALIRSYG